MKIEILGTGCPKCRTLADKTEEAAKKMGVDYELCKVTDLSEIMKRGVVMTPALVVDGEVKAAGTMPSEGELMELLK